MARTLRTRTVWSVIGLVVFSSVAASPMPRVRSSNPAIVAALVTAQERSQTFRSLVRTIEETDGIVYVERGRCLHGVPACLSLSIVASGGFRLLRILVDGTSDLLSLMATIGHELRHAIELLTEPSVRTTAAAYLYYVREAPTVRDAFETAAAIQAGSEIRRELTR